jgi:hypothetical protein
VTGAAALAASGNAQTIIRAHFRADRTAPVVMDMNALLSMRIGLCMARLMEQGSSANKYYLHFVVGDDRLNHAK